MSVLSAQTFRNVFAAAGLVGLAACSPTDNGVLYPASNGNIGVANIPAHKDVLKRPLGTCDTIITHTHTFRNGAADGQASSKTVDNITIFTREGGDLTQVAPNEGLFTVGAGYGVRSSAGDDPKIIGDFIGAKDVSGGQAHMSVIIADVGSNDNNKSIQVVFDLVGQPDAVRTVKLHADRNGYAQFSADAADFGAPIEGFHVQEQDQVSLTLAGVAMSSLRSKDCSSESRDRNDDTGPGPDSPGPDSPGPDSPGPDTGCGGCNGGGRGNDPVDGPDGTDTDANNAGNNTGNNPGGADSNGSSGPADSGPANSGPAGPSGPGADGPGNAPGGRGGLTLLDEPKQLWNFPSLDLA